MNHKISIIVPVYNAAKWLPECIESILKQSYKNLEVIIVNDGSTDGSAAICDAAVTQDTRVRVFHKMNSGVSDARNYGLDMVTGDYIIFIDSDDIVAHNMVELLYNLCIENNCNLVQCSYKRPEEYNNSSSNSTSSQELTIYEGKDMHWGLLGRGKTRSMLWAKIFERSLFASVQFPSGLIHEDEAAIHRILYHARRMAVTDEKLYLYRKTPNSIMNKNFSVKRYDILSALQDRIEFYNEAGWHVLSFAAAQRYSVTTIELYRKTLESFTHLAQHLEYLAKLYAKNWEILRESPLLTHEIRQQHIEWLKDPLSGDIYNVFKYFGNLENIQT